PGLTALPYTTLFRARALLVGIVRSRARGRRHPTHHQAIQLRRRQSKTFRCELGNRNRWIEKAGRIILMLCCSIKISNIEEFILLEKRGVVYNRDHDT